MNPQQAQALHDKRQRDDPDHDKVSCWCCCLDCDFDYEAVTAARTAQPPEGPGS